MTVTTGTTATGGRHVTICHVTGSKTHPFHVIVVDQHAVPALLRHGDHVGACTGTEQPKQTGKPDHAGKPAAAGDSTTTDTSGKSGDSGKPATTGKPDTAGAEQGDGPGNSGHGNSGHGNSGHGK